MSFENYKVGDIAEVQTGPFGSQLHQKDYTNIGTPIITVEHLGQNHIIHENTPYVSDEDKIRLNKYTIKKKEIDYSKVGSVDRRAYVSEDEDGWLFSGRCLRVRVTNEQVSAHYLSYYFGLENFKEYVRRIAVGATMPSLNTKIMKELPIQIPDIDTQEKITNILSSLDEKIKVNNQINKKLEEMAQTIFKQWFVDFEFPNEEGKPYKSSGGAMVESELGMIPEEWGVKKLSDVVTIKHGYAFKSKDFSDDRTSLLILSPGNFKVGGGFKNDKFKYLSEGTTFSEEYILNEKDLIITMTDLSKEGDTLGYPAFVPRSKKEKYLHNQRLGRVMAKQEFSNYYLYLLMCTTSYRAHILGTSTGTTVKHTAPTRIEEYKFVKPSSLVLTKFDDIVQQMFESIQERDFENKNLSIARDTLLPKLMSGKIYVPIEK